MQEIIVNQTAILELRMPEIAISDHAFEQMCHHLHATGTALETDADSGDSERIAWFPCGKDEQLTRARIAAAVMLVGASEEYITMSLLDDDWATAWQKDWQGMAIGRRLWVRPSFCPPPQDDKLDIVLDPGMAFGTGQHATTQLCLAAIERICDTKMPDSMLDMGAGSGLLAITAAKLGIADVYAVDCDPIAVHASKVNAEINHVRCCCSKRDTPPEQKFALVVANILADPLLNMAQAMAVCTGEYLILSGLLQTQAQTVRNVYEQAGLHFLSMDIKEEWVAVMFRREDL